MNRQSAHQAGQTIGEARLRRRRLEGRAGNAGTCGGQGKQGAGGIVEIGLERALVGHHPGGDIEAAGLNQAFEALRHESAAALNVAKLDRRAQAAFLPLSLVDPYLAALERRGRDPLREIADVNPLNRLWRMARWRP